METQLKYPGQPNPKSGLGTAYSIRRIGRWAGSLLVLAILTGCATGGGVRLPPVAADATDKIHSGKFVWIDLVTEDVVSAAAFYSGFFGWRAARSRQNEDYYLFFRDDRPIGGMVALDNRDRQKPESFWMHTLSVNNVDQTIALVRNHGGKVLEGPLNAEGRGRMALISDPSGAPLILLRAMSGDPDGEGSKAGEWFWTDLFTRDAPKAGVFYNAVAGYQAERVQVEDDHRYHLLKQDGRVRAGMVELDWNDLKDNWLPYFKVEDVGQSIETARRLGGLLIVRKDDVAILSDSTGAAFGIQKR